MIKFRIIFLNRLFNFFSTFSYPALSCYLTIRVRDILISSSKKLRNCRSQYLLLVNLLESKELFIQFLSIDFAIDQSIRLPILYASPTND